MKFTAFHLKEFIYDNRKSTRNNELKRTRKTHF